MISQKPDSASSVIKPDSAMKGSASKSAFPVRGSLKKKQARPGPQASESFRTTTMPDGRVINNMYVPGKDGKLMDDSQEKMDFSSTQRVDFSDRVMQQDIAPAGRHGASHEAWATDNLRHKANGMIPSAQANASHDRFRPRDVVRPQTAPTDATVWQTTTAATYMREKRFRPDGSVPPLLPKPDPVDDDIALILEAHTNNVDVREIVQGWLQKVPLLERDIGKRMLHEVAIRCAASSGGLPLRPPTRLGRPGSRPGSRRDHRRPETAGLASSHAHATAAATAGAAASSSSSASTNGNNHMFSSSYPK